MALTLALAFEVLVWSLAYSFGFVFLDCPFENSFPMLYVTDCFPEVLPNERGCSGMLDRSGKSTVIIMLSLSASTSRASSTLLLLSSTFDVVDVDEMLIVGKGDDLLVDFDGFLLVDLVEKMLFLDLVGNFWLKEDETLLVDMEGRSTVMLLITLLMLESMLSSLVWSSLLGSSSSANWFPRTTTWPKSTANFLHQTEIHLISSERRLGGRVRTMSSEDNDLRTGTFKSR